MVIIKKKVGNHKEGSIKETLDLKGSLGVRYKMVTFLTS